MAGYWHGRRIADSFLELIRPADEHVEESIRDYLKEEDDPRLRPPGPTIRPPEQSSRVNRVDWANLWPETKVHVTRSGGACSKDGLSM